MFSPGIEPGTFCVLDRCDNRYTTKTRWPAEFRKRMSSGEKGKVRIRIEGAACCHRRPVRLHWATTGQQDFPSVALGLLFKDWEIFFFAPRQAFTYQLASFADQTQQNGSPNQQDGNTFQQSGPQKQQSGQQVLYPSNAGKHGIGPTLLPLVAYFCFICFIALWAHITDKGLPIFHNFLLGFCCCFIGRVSIPFFYSCRGPNGQCT